MNVSRRCSLFAIVSAQCAFSVVGAQTRPTSPGRPSFAEPAISPDGREIAFVSGGDIWSVATAGGDAHLLVSHPANESRPMYSPDGKRLAFMSTRSGSADIWILDFATGALRRLTFDDGAEQLDAWSRDGKWVYFSSGAHDVGGTADEYRVSADGGTPMIVAGDRYVGEFMGAPSPDGSTLAIVARGNAQSQWWRKGHSHLDESELWLVRPSGSAAPSYEQLTPLGAKRAWPMWDAAGRTLYFVSDEGGPQNLWSIGASRGSTAKRLTSFRDGRVLYPSMTSDGKTIAFERDFGIWTADVGSGATKQVAIALRGAAAVPGDEHLVLTNGFQEMALSPDGKKIAFVARGEVFATSATDGGDAVRVTRTPSIESQLAWAPDSRRVAYASNRDGAWHIYAYDFGSNKETQLTRGPKSDIQARWSPDGAQLAFLRDAREVHVLDIASGRDRIVANGVFSRPPFSASGEGNLAWSPDGKFIAYLSAGTKLMMNAYVAAVNDGTAPADNGKEVTYLANTNANGLSWSADGTYLMLSSSMRLEPSIVARVDLVPHVPKMREEQFTALFRDQTPGRGVPTPADAPTSPARDTSTRAETRPVRAAVRIVYDGIKDRLTVIPTGLEVDALSMSRDGKALLLVATVAGQQNIYVYSLDEASATPAVARQVTSTAGRKTSVQWAPDGRSIFYLEGGRINSVAVDSRAVKLVDTRAELDVDFDREKMEVFNQAWEYLNDNFYDPQFHGVDWNAVHAAYAPVIAGARTTDEMRRDLNLMIGELNASHMGIAGPTPPGTPTTGPVTGRIGLSFDRAAYEQRGEFVVTDITPLSPAAVSDSIKKGDRITAVDGKPIGAGASLDSVLAYKIGKRLVLTVADAGTKATHDVALRPVNAATERALLYRAWVAQRRAYVTKLSGGRLGYVHMADMGGGAIDQLNLDLDSENHSKEGVVLDIRNNNGGFVNGHALDVLSRQPYVDMVRRGVPSVPGRPVLGQRALGAPTVLVTNQYTLSDGENFTEGYRVMKLGKVVGEPTAGWDVYTGAGTMVDGTTVRLPFMRNAQLDGTALEQRPRAVDIPVERAMGESYAGRDTQLEAAVKELLAEIDAKRASARE
jgi:tricorn protease